MPRQYIVNSWVGAAEFPEGDQYSGEQIGNRYKPSLEVQVERSGDRWRTVGVDQHFTKTGAANIKAYADIQEKPKRQPAKKKSAFQKADLAGNNLERLENISIELDQEFARGDITAAQWTVARKQLDRRLERAWRRVLDANNWDEEPEPEEIQQETQQKHQRNTKRIEQNTLDNQQEQGLSFSHELIDSLSEGNCFKKPLQKLLTAKEKMVKILEILKS